MPSPLPGYVLRVLEALEAAGHEAYVVGGAVRDLLLGLEPSDYDVATSARPQEILALFSRIGWKTIPKGIAYGVVSVVDPSAGEEIEIATFRKEYYPLDYARRVVRVEYADSIYEDLARRDFTINAMAMDSSGGVLDPFGGREDLRRGVVRFVGEPSERIREDPLRMLRAARFVARLGFRIDGESMEAIRENHGKLRFVSRERVGQEVLKAMSGREPWRFPLILYDTQLYRVVYPHLGPMATTRHDHRRQHYGETVLEHTADVMRRLASTGLAGPELMLAAMLHDSGKPFVARHEGGRVTFHGHEALGARIATALVLKHWRLPRRLATFVQAVVRFHHAPLHTLDALRDTRKAAARLVARYWEYAEPLALHAYADTGEEVFLRLYHEVAELRARHKARLLTGRDVMQLYGLSPGPEVGKLLRLAQEVAFQRRLKSREEVVEALCEDYGICPRQPALAREPA